MEEISNIRPWVTIKQAQAATGFSGYALRQWVKNGQVRFCRSGNTVYLHLPTLLAPDFQPGNMAEREAAKQ